MTPPPRSSIRTHVVQLTLADRKGRTAPLVATVHYERTQRCPTRSPEPFLLHTFHCRESDWKEAMCSIGRPFHIERGPVLITKMDGTPHAMSCPESVPVFVDADLPDEGVFELDTFCVSSTHFKEVCAEHWDHDCYLNPENPTQ